MTVARLTPGSVLRSDGETMVPSSTIKKLAAPVSVTFPSRSSKSAAAFRSTSRACWSAR